VRKTGVIVSDGLVVCTCGVIVGVADGRGNDECEGLCVGVNNGCVSVGVIVTRYKWLRSRILGEPIGFIIIISFNFKVLYTKIDVRSRCGSSSTHPYAALPAKIFLENRPSRTKALYRSSLGYLQKV
jgi:hypothetical protein